MSGMPWDNASIVGAVAVSAIISLLKRLGMPSAWARPATWVAGFVWLVLAKAAGGEDWLKAIVSSLIVILGAPGFYELVSKPAGKALSRS